MVASIPALLTDGLTCILLNRYYAIGTGFFVWGMVKQDVTVPSPDLRGGGIVCATMPPYHLSVLALFCFLSFVAVLLWWRNIVVPAAVGYPSALLLPPYVYLLLPGFNGLWAT